MRLCAAVAAATFVGGGRAHTNLAALALAYSALAFAFAGEECEYTRDEIACLHDG